MALLESGRILYNDTISVKIKSADKDEAVATLNVKIRLDLTPSHHQVLLCDLTDTNDPFFLYTLVLGESDFHALKNEQRLLVDFQQFPSQLVKLLEETKRQVSPIPATPAHGVNQSFVSSPGTLGCSVNGGAGGAIFAVLNIVTAHEALFSITESNQFRELQHLSLHFRRGNDAAVKEYLAAKLQDTMNSKSDLQTRLSAVENECLKLRETEKSARDDMDRMKMELFTTKEAMSSSFSKELADVKESHALTVSSIQQKLNSEKSSLEKSLRDQIGAKASSCEAAEAKAADLAEKLYKLELTYKQTTDRLEIADGGRKKDGVMVEELREQCRQLEKIKFQQEKELNEQSGRILTLEERVAGREQSYANQLQITKQIEEKQKHFEEALNENKVHCQELEEKCAESVAEINKGNQIILKLQTQVKNLKSKLRVKAVALQQQEKTIADLERDLHAMAKTEEVRKTEIADSREREARLQQEVDQYREKLNESHSLIASNQQVIEYLNKQLTERDLKTFAPLSTVTLPMTSGREPTARTLTTREAIDHAGVPSIGSQHTGGTTTAAHTHLPAYSPASSAGASTAAPGTNATEAEARQKRIEALLQSRGVPLVGPVRYMRPTEN
ncbi:unnamed protein product [Amoebophrya sp. A25]|nr:unnamed protein product [Amoebophrya sp. A25]|eukprot:GSA25T00012370001.1